MCFLEQIIGNKHVKFSKTVIDGVLIYTAG